MRVPENVVHLPSYTAASTTFFLHRALEISAIDMAADPTNSMYKRNYMEAQQHMDDDNFEACADTAKYNLTDPTLPPYYRILNVISLVSASTDWDAVEPYRRAVGNSVQWIAVLSTF